MAGGSPTEKQVSNSRGSPLRYEKTGRRLPKLTPGFVVQLRRGKQIFWTQINADLFYRGEPFDCAQGRLRERGDKESEIRTEKSEENLKIP